MRDATTARDAGCNRLHQDATGCSRLLLRALLAWGAPATAVLVARLWCETDVLDWAVSVSWDSWASYSTGGGGVVPLRRDMDKGSGTRTAAKADGAAAKDVAANRPAVRTADRRGEEAASADDAATRDKRRWCALITVPCRPTDWMALWVGASD